MRKTMVIAAREYIAAVRTKAFIISIVLMPVLMLGTLLVQVIMKDKVDIADKRIAVLDRSVVEGTEGQTQSRVIAPVLAKAAEIRNETEIRDEDEKQVKPRYLVELVEPREDLQAQKLALSERVRDKELHAFVDIGRNVIETGSDAEDASVAYHSENSALDDARGWIAQTVNNQIRNLRMARAGLDAEMVNKVTSYVRVEPLGLVSVDRATGEVQEAQRASEGAAIIVPMVIMMMMFAMIMMGATPLINSVLEEKMQRIAEVLLGSATPFQLMMGKLLGTIGVSVTIVAVYVVGAVLAANRTGMTQYVPYDIFPWFLVYQVAAIFMFGAMFIAIGSACNDLKEAQSLMMPVWILLVVPMFVWIQVVKEPVSSFATALAFVPPFTPMLMLLRQTTEVAIPVWQPWVGLAGVTAFTVLCVWLAGRVFRVGLLLQGKPPKVSDMLRWALRG